MNNKKAMLALSGGMDSTTIFYWALNKGYDLSVVSFYYGQNHSKELDFAEEHCKINNVSYQKIDISFLGEITSKVSSLTQGAKYIPEGFYSNNNMKSTVVPFRNGIILSILTAVAETEDCDIILYGAHSGDHAIYPDCRVEFVNNMVKAIEEGTYNKIQMQAPFINYNKISILKEGIELGINYSKTWTCYKGGKEPCGKCGSCVERTEAFIKNNKIDPLYKTQDSWQEAVNFYYKVKEG